MAEGHGSFRCHELAPQPSINRIGRRAREGVVIELRKCTQYVYGRGALASAICAEGMLGEEVMPQTGNTRAVCARRITSVMCATGFRHGGGEQSPFRDVVAGNHTALRGSVSSYVYLSSMGAVGGSGAFAI